MISQIFFFFFFFFFFFSRVTMYCVSANQLCWFQLLGQSSLGNDPGISAQSASPLHYLHDSVNLPLAWCPLVHANQSILRGLKHDGFQLCKIAFSACKSLAVIFICLSVCTSVRITYHIRAKAQYSKAILVNYKSNNYHKYK